MAAAAPITQVDDSKIVEQLEQFFCQGAFTSQLSAQLGECVKAACFAPVVAPSEDDDGFATDDGLALLRNAAFANYSALIDGFLDQFVAACYPCPGGVSAAEHEQKIAAAVLDAVDDNFMKHMACVPYVAAAMDMNTFLELVMDTADMLNFSQE
jgi:hypothetical protein